MTENKDGDTKFSTVLLDYTKVIDNGSELEKAIQAKTTEQIASTTAYHIGLILILPDNITSRLTDMPVSHRVEYINRQEFIDNIREIFYILYNYRKKICILTKRCISSEENLRLVLECLFTSVEPNTLIWIALEDQDSIIINRLVAHGFHNPYVTGLSPSLQQIPVSLAMTKSNIAPVKFTKEDVLRQVNDAISQYNSNDCCKLHAKLTKNAIGLLKKASHMGIKMDKQGKISQKELTGELVVKSTKIVYRKPKEANKKILVYIIDVNRGSIESGEEENVNVSATRYNFHSHPKEAYIRHSVEKAWPSVTDYLGYHKLGKNTIFHCVAALEGLYIISFGKYWANRLNTTGLRKFIDSNYDIDYAEKYTPEEYIQVVNKILFKNYPIFEVKFFEWKNADKIFSVNYPSLSSSLVTIKNNNSLFPTECVSTQEGAVIHRRLYGK